MELTKEVLDDTPADFAPETPPRGEGEDYKPAPVPRRWLRQALFFSSVFFLTLVAVILMADFFWRMGWTAGRVFLLVVFALLFGYIAFGCCHAVFGFFMRRGDGDRYRLTRLRKSGNERLEGFSTAVVMPIYNEDVKRVFSGLQEVFESLLRTGQLDHFDIFILSDTNDPDIWVEEEAAWLELCQRYDALGKVFYRRRERNDGKKAGNIANFCRAWGRRYRYMVVLDADSIMSGGTLVKLVQMMEAHPAAGLVQTAPMLANAQSLFGRLQQFASRLYGPVFLAGLNYWQNGTGNYWGHNAIIRVAPFMAYCDLPQLPGRKPFGGQILSHDFAEAALMRRAGWEVWLAYDMEGSFEEGPQDVIESAKRDRRWCQGNLQHSMLLLASGLRRRSRIHLANGIMGYLASPLWLLFLIVSTLVLFKHEQSGLSLIPVPGFTFFDLGLLWHGVLLFVLTMGVLFLPKVLCILDIFFDPARARLFGGRTGVLASVVTETFFSALLAPVIMLFHTKFVVMILLGKGVNWAAQNRDASGVGWGVALRTHAVHVLSAIGWGVFAYRLSPVFFWWLSPVLLGLVLSPVLTVFLSRPSLGAWFRKMGFFLTPEEISPPPELVNFTGQPRKKGGEKLLPSPVEGLTRAVLDPYVNALHVSLLREKKLELDRESSLHGQNTQKLRMSLADKLLRRGADSMENREKLLLLSDADMMLWMHRQAWTRPAANLDSSWVEGIRGYGYPELSEV